MSKTVLIITADDFGKSASINRAVEQAARDGILQVAGLMVTGGAARDAVRIAKQTTSLQTGLHLTLTEGRPACSGDAVPDLITPSGHFKTSPALTGLALHLSKTVQHQVEREVAAQFEAFADTGLPFDHVDCHHHLHIHPELFDIVLKNARTYRLKSIRIPWEPWALSGPISGGHALRNFFYRMVFTPLSARCRQAAHAGGLISCNGVFGLYNTGEITKSWILLLLDRLAGMPGTFELYTHPCDDSSGTGRRELDALISPEVRKKLTENGIGLARYRDMTQ